MLFLLGGYSYRNYKFYNRIKTCEIAAEIKKYKSIINKKKNRHDIKELLGKSKLNSTELLISKALIDLSISHDEFVLIKNVLQ